MSTDVQLAVVTEISPKTAEERKARAELLLAGRAGLRKLKAQFPECGNGRIAFAVLECAVLDLMGRSMLGGKGEPPERFLSGGMWIVQAAGIDPDWVRRVLIKVGVLTRVAA